MDFKPECCFKKEWIPPVFQALYGAIFWYNFRRKFNAITFNGLVSNVQFLGTCRDD